MARTVYYVWSHAADGTNEYKQITGTEFYSFVSTEEGKKRCLYGWKGTILSSLQRS